MLAGRIRRLMRDLVIGCWVLMVEGGSCSSCGRLVWRGERGGGGGWRRRWLRSRDGDDAAR